MTKKKTAKKSANAKAAAFNQKAQWQAYKQLQMRADKAWAKFRGDVARNARSDVLIQDQRQLILLLGECNYMARECMRMSGEGKKP